MGYIFTDNSVADTKAQLLSLLPKHLKIEVKQEGNSWVVYVHYSKILTRLPKRLPRSYTLGWTKEEVLSDYAVDIMKYLGYKVYKVERL